MSNNLRYRYAKNEADRLGQVYTPDIVADLLMSSIPSRRGEEKKIIDIGAGLGALSLAAFKKHPKSSALMVEIDRGSVKALSAISSDRVNVLNVDGLELGWDDSFNADIVISNPNYGMLPLNNTIKTLLSTVDLRVPVTGNWVRGDAAFAARAWHCLKNGASLGLIVASPMIRDPAFKELRKQLISQLSELCITQLDTNAFDGAEVQAFLITGLRSESKRKRILIRKASLDGNVEDELEISWKDGVQRLDYSYYNAMKKLGINTHDQYDTLASIGATIVRGSKSKNDFQSLGVNAFHTTDFRGFTGELEIQGESAHLYKTAEPGDILIPRVGSRCLNNQARVISGRGYFTDCVYKIVTKSNFTEKVWKTISSSFGTEWRLVNASGNCAKHLTVNTLMDMPLLS